MIGFIGIAILVTERPLGLSSDSIYYLEGAENMLAGKGYYAFNQFYNSEADQLSPIVDYQPGYSFLIALTRNLTGLTLESSARWVNIFFGLLYIVCWSLIGKSVLSPGKPSLLILFIVSLVSFYGFWIFLRSALSEVVFIGFIGLLGLSCLRVHKARSKAEVYSWILVASIASIGVIMTRYAGISLILGSILFLLVNNRIKNCLKDWQVVFIYLIPISIILGGWLIRNNIVASEMIFNPITATPQIEAGFKVASSILNYFIISVLAIPNRVQASGFIALAFLLGLAGHAFWQKKAILFRKEEFSWAWLMINLILYVGMITFIGLHNPNINPASGYRRYFNIIQPFMLLLSIHFLSIYWNSSTFVERVSKFGICGIIAVSLLSSVNRTSLLLYNSLDARTEGDVIVDFNPVNLIPEKDLVLSNLSIDYQYRFSYPFRQVKTIQDVHSVARDWYREYNDVVILLNKKIGIEFGDDSFQPWDEFIENLTYEKMYENQEFILIRLPEFHNANGN